MAARYAATIRKHTGLRKIEPDMCDNKYDPEHKESLHEVVLQTDLPPFETSPEVAEEDLQRRQRHGDRAAAAAAVVVTQDGSGITDPYEWYEHVHVSELGNCLGSSMGGLSSLRKMHRGRYLDRAVQGDILQETFVNTTGAWINMLLTSSAGPIRTPVGACATSLKSLDTTCDLIVSKKAKVCIVGGVEDFVEDVSFEFANMKATCDTDAELAAGRSPREMSRPPASSRTGFVEAQGCGVQVVTTAELALSMGLPIFAIVGYTNMSGDRPGRSVPAPGKGVCW